LSENAARKYGKTSLGIRFTEALKVIEFAIEVDQDGLDRRKALPAKKTSARPRPAILHRL